MTTFLLNLLGSFMSFYGVFSYTSGVIKAFATKGKFSNAEAITSICIAAIGFSILLTF